MSKMLKILIWSVVVVVGLGGLHSVLNLGLNPFRGGADAARQATYRVGFLPVT